MLVFFPSKKREKSYKQFSSVLSCIVHNLISVVKPQGRISITQTTQKGCYKIPQSVLIKAHSYDTTELLFYTIYINPS